MANSGSSPHENLHKSEQVKPLNVAILESTTSINCDMSELQKLNNTGFKIDIDASVKIFLSHPEHQNQKEEQKQT